MDPDMAGIIFVQTCTLTYWADVGGIGDGTDIGVRRPCNCCVTGWCGRAFTGRRHASRLQCRGTGTATAQAPREPRRLDVLPSTVRIHLEAFRASRTKGKWIPVQDQRPLVVANESSGTTPLTDICSHPKGPAPRLTFSVKGPFLGYSLSDCKPFGADAVDVLVTCATREEH